MNHPSTAFTIVATLFIVSHLAAYAILAALLAKDEPIWLALLVVELLAILTFVCVVTDEFNPQHGSKPVAEAKQMEAAP